MTLKQYLIIMILSTILCWTAWGVVIVNVDPTQAPAMGLIFFYVSFFLALLGSSSVILFSFYELFSQGDLPMFRHVERSFRNACGIAVILSTVLYLQGRRILHLSPVTFFFLLLAPILGCIALAWIASRRTPRTPPPGGNPSLLPTNR